MENWSKNAKISRKTLAETAHSTYNLHRTFNYINIKKEFNMHAHIPKRRHLCLLLLLFFTFTCLSPGISAQAASVKTPTASRSVTYGNSLVTLDVSNSSEGYCMVKYTGQNPTIRVQISKSGIETYTYTLNSSGNYEVFPFSEGSGSYTIKVFENISGNQYSQAFSQTVSVQLSSELTPFLYPNQFCNYSAASAAAPLADQLTQGAANELGKVAAIYDWVVDNISYDYNLAATVSSGYLPNVDNILATKKGICFDYAALMTSMLRMENVPTKLVVGYSGSVYHAWISVYTRESGWIDNVIYFDGNTWKLMDPTFASNGKRSSEIMAYIGNGSNYRQRFSY